LEYLVLSRWQFCEVKKLLLCWCSWCWTLGI
jgi:hypothetical protein